MRLALRNREIARAVAAGEPLAEIGRRYELSRQRVFQIAADAGLRKKPRVKLPREKPPGEVTLHGETRSLAEWARVTGIRHATIWGRLRRGWPPEKALASSCDAAA